MSSGRWKNPKPCGTDAAYKRHLAHREVPCDLCTEAHRAYQDGTPYRLRVRAIQAAGGACSHCGKRPRAHRNGLCKICYNRWVYYGRPEDGPPPPYAAKLARMEDYAFLRAQGKTRVEAAERMGICRRTAERYEAQLRRQPELVEAA